mgnify:CR=1 FL=1
MNKTNCPICSQDADFQQNKTLVYDVNCKFCGKFSLRRMKSLESVHEPHLFALKVILNKIWKSNRISNEYYLIDQLREDIIQNYYSARDNCDQRWVNQQFVRKYILEVSQQVNNLILLIGDTNNDNLDFSLEADRASTICVKISKYHSIAYKIGSFEHEKLKTHYDFLERKQLISKGYLTTEGWIEYEQLNTGKLTNIAFMAMKFGEKDSDIIFDNFKNVIQKNFGIELQRLDKSPKSGLIDMNLRNKIKSSRFIISDLSHQNNGAYWEAGFAEGLGKIVIYSCEKSKEGDIHFDVRNLYRINYSLENLDQSNEDLTDVIKASIPELN